MYLEDFGLHVGFLLLDLLSLAPPPLSLCLTNTHLEDFGLHVGFLLLDLVFTRHLLRGQRRYLLRRDLSLFLVKV